MEQIKISAETAQIKDTFITFLRNYNVQITQFMNTLQGNNGTPTDSAISFDSEGNITIYQIAPDKGYILGEVTGQETPFQLIKYSDLPVGGKYLMLEENRFLLYIKEETGNPDFKIGAFKTLSDAVIEFNSEGVKKAMQDLSDFKAAKEKEAKRTQKRLARLNPSSTEQKPEEDSAPQVSVENV